MLKNKKFALIFDIDSVLSATELLAVAGARSGAAETQHETAALAEIQAGAR